MPEFQRYAIYLCPPAGSGLAEFGAAWLGWDPDAAQVVRQPELQGLPMPVDQLTAVPRKYGFHATLKAPFRLATGTDEAELIAAMRRFAGIACRFEIPALRLGRIGNFLALVPAAPSVALQDLACDVVRVFDAFRAPPTPGETQRRRAVTLSPSQEAMLAQWGYPFVMSEFRFHLTLTGPLDAGTLDKVEPILARELAPYLDQPLPAREICLFGEREDGFFEVLKRFALARDQAAAAS